MSASVPSPQRADQFRRIPDAAEQIEQAVVSLTRAVLSEGGRLVFGGHPAISPMVAMVAGEYRASRRAESRAERPPANVRIYQSGVFRERAADSTMLMFDLGMADIVWTEGDPEESFDASPSKGPRYPRSLARMRREMLDRERPDCMVAIGGMEGVIEEARLYREMFPGRPIYVLERTGGASALLREKLGADALDAVDERILSRMPPRPSRPERSAEGAGLFEERSLRREAIAKSVIPYPLIVQTIVEELVRSRS
jgi:hypothetical protein